MAKTGDELPRWAQIIIAALIGGALIWAVVPKHIIWVALGIAVVGVVAYLVYRRQGIAPLISVAKRVYKWAIGTEKRSEAKRPVTPPLSSSETSLLIVAVGSRCENPNCHSQVDLEVHHIKPRGQDGSNSVWNLIVLCHGCHGVAQRGGYQKSLLKRWIQKHSYERRGVQHSREWKYY